MVRLARILLIVITLYAIPYTLYDVFAQDKIIAIVNNDVITQKDLSDFVNFMRMQLSQEYAGGELESKIESMKSDLIDRLIEDRLILQEAKRALEEAKKNKNQPVVNQLAVEDSRIKARINETRKHYASDKEFQDALGQQGLTQADIESKIKEQLLMYNIIELKVKNKIMVNPAEITDFYQKNQEKFKTNEKRRVTLIAVDDEKLVKEIYTDLRQTKDIEAVAAKYSLKLDNFDIERNKELRKDIEEVIFKLNIKEVSSPTKVDNSFYIFRLDNITLPKQEGLEEAQDNIYNFLFETKMQEGLAKWLDEIKKQAYIKVSQQ